MEVNLGEPHRTYHTRIDSSGRIVVPADCRLRKDVAAGEPVVIVEDEHGLHILTLAQVVHEAQELFAKAIPPGVSLVEELHRERREEAARE